MDNNSQVASLPTPIATAGTIERFTRIAPGLLLTGSIAGAAIVLRKISGLSFLSPMILATFLGMVLHNTIGAPALAKPGIGFSLKRVLRFGIILLGLQLFATQVAQVGIAGVGVVATTLVATFVFTKWVGRIIGVDSKLAELIAAGTSICGASAVIATNTVTESSDENVAYAVACVTVFGSLAMFIYRWHNGAVRGRKFCEGDCRVAYRGRRTLRAGRNNRQLLLG